MDLNDARAFVSVAKLGSFTAAAKVLDAPKATVSRRIARLEESLGVRLLQRTTRRISLTEAGASYVEHAQRALESFAEAERAAKNRSDKPSGILRVSAPFDIGRDHFTRFFPELRRMYPELQIHLELTQRRVDLVAEGFDVVLRGGNLQDSELAARKLFDSGVGLYASPRYLRKSGTPTTLEELKDHAILGMTGLATATRLRLVGPRGPCEAEVTPWLITNEFGVLRQATLDGLGIALLETTAAGTDVKSGKLERVLPKYGISGGGLYALFPSARHLPLKVRVFIDFLAERLTSGR